MLRHYSTSCQQLLSLYVLLHLWTRSLPPKSLLLPSFVTVFIVTRLFCKMGYLYKRRDVLRRIIVNMEINLILNSCNPEPDTKAVLYKS